MKKTLLALSAAAALTISAVAVPAPAQAQRGVAAGVAAGLLGGAIVGGAILPLCIGLFGLFLWWYAGKAASRGWLR